MRRACSSVRLSVCLFVCLSVAKLQKRDRIWIKFCGLVQNDMSTAVIWSKSKPDVELTSGRIQWHVIREPPATLQGAATWRTQCRDPRATCHIAGCCHRAKSMSWSCTRFCLINLFSLLNNFHRASAQHYADARYWYRNSVRPSVCPSRSGIVSKHRDRYTSVNTPKRREQNEIYLYAAVNLKRK